MRIGIVFKYENKTGGGHFWRCFNFASLIKQKRRIIYFLSHNLPNKYLNLLKKNNYSFIKLKKKNLRNLENEILSNLKRKKINNVLTDCYDFNQKFKLRLKKQSKYLLVIDDHTDKKHSADVYINNNYLDISSKKKIKKLNPKSILFIGNNNLIINKKFIYKNPKFKKNNKIKNIFIFFGSSDNTFETLKILEIAKKFPFLRFFIIVGNLNKKLNLISSRSMKIKNIYIHYDLLNNDILNIIKKSDLAIGAGGINMIERIYFGLPSIVIQTAKNQEKGINYLNKKRNIYFIGKSKNVSLPKIQKSIENLLENKENFDKLKGNTIRASLELRKKNNFYNKINSILKYK